MSNAGCCHIMGGPRPISGRSYRQRLTKTKKEFCQQETAFRLKLQWLFPGSPAYWITLQILDLSASTIPWTNSLKFIRYFFFFLYFHILKNICIYTYTHTFYWLCLSPEPQLTQLYIHMNSYSGILFSVSLSGKIWKPL